MGLLNSFWRTLVATTVLLGLLYIPSDIKGLPQALRAPLGFLVHYKDTLILGYAVALTLWMAWRDAYPHLKPRLATVFGRQPLSEVIVKLDDCFAEGVALRNIVMSEEPIDLATESAQFRDWDADVTELLRGLSLRERSYFRTLDRFEGQHAARQTPDLGRSHLETMWNEKLRRLREIIMRAQQASPLAGSSKKSRHRVPTGGTGVQMSQRSAKSAAELESMIMAELREHPECESVAVVIIGPTGPGWNAALVASGATLDVECEERLAAITTRLREQFDLAE
jgi:hypothetical protein